VPGDPSPISIVAIRRWCSVSEHACNADADDGQEGVGQLAMMAFRASGVAVTGALQTLLDVELKGVRPARLTVWNRGFTALTAGIVEHLGDVLPNTPQPVNLDTAVFGTLAAQAAAQLVIPMPIERIRFRATCTAGSGTLLDLWLNTPARTG